MQRRFLPALGLTLVAACGGKVIWVGGGDDGAGGTHGQSSSTGISEDPAPSSSATGMISNACQALCEIPACGQGDPMGCLQNCLAGYTPGCEGQADDFIKCAVANVDQSTCQLPPGACVAESDAWSACMNPGGCTTNGCDATQTSCKCDGSCIGQPVTASCAMAPDGSITCQCTLNGNFAGTCTDFNLACDLLNGCCSQFFGSTGLEQPP